MHFGINYKLLLYSSDCISLKCGIYRTTYDDSMKMNSKICIQTCLAINVTLYYVVLRE